MANFSIICYALCFPALAVCGATTATGLLIIGTIAATISVYTRDGRPGNA